MVNDNRGWDGGGVSMQVRRLEALGDAMVVPTARRSSPVAMGRPEGVLY